MTFICRSSVNSFKTTSNFPTGISLKVSLIVSNPIRINYSKEEMEQEILSVSEKLGHLYYGISFFFFSNSTRHFIESREYRLFVNISKIRNLKRQFKSQKKKKNSKILRSKSLYFLALKMKDGTTVLQNVVVICNITTVAYTATTNKPCCFYRFYQF